MDIVLHFKGHTTVEEAYQLHIKSFKDALSLICHTGTYQEKIEKRREILELMAIVDNSMFADKHPGMAKKRQQGGKLYGD